MLLVVMNSNIVTISIKVLYLLNLLFVLFFASLFPFVDVYHIPAFFLFIPYRNQVWHTHTLQLFAYLTDVIRLTRIYFIFTFFFILTDDYGPTFLLLLFLG